MNDAVPHVREATVADAEVTGRIHFASWLAAYRGLLPDSFLDGQNESAFVERRRTDLASRRPGDRRGAWVVEAAGVVRGFAVGGPTRDDDLSPETAEVYAIYLDPAWFGRGLGRALMDRVLADLSAGGFVRASLWVFEGNLRARRFYERIGFSLDAAAPARTWRREGHERPEVRYVMDMDAGPPPAGGRAC